MNGAVIDTSARSGTTNSGPASRKTLMMLNR